MPARTKKRGKGPSTAGSEQDMDGLQPAECEAGELESVEVVPEDEPANGGKNDEPPKRQIPRWSIDPPGHIPREISEVRLVRKQGQVVEGLIQEIRRRNLRVKKGSSATGAGVVGDKHPDAIRLLLDGVASGHVVVDLDGIQQAQQG